MLSKRTKELLIATVSALVITIIVAVLVAKGTRTLGAFIAVAGSVAVIAYIVITNFIIKKNKS
jgi:hypothetical protein